MHFLFFLEGVLRVVGGGGCLACNAWRYVLFFTLCFIFFGRRLVLQLPPPPLALTGGVTRLARQDGAASVWTHHVA
jgi:hypothetical protein